MKIELKPCPFCGKDGAQEITNIHTLEECSNFEDERCPAYDETGPCPMTVVVCSMDKGGCGASTGWHVKSEDAIRAWNRRDGE